MPTVPEKKYQEDPEWEAGGLEKTRERLRRLHEELATDAHRLALKADEAQQAMRTYRAQSAGLELAAQGFSQAINAISKALKDRENPNDIEFEEEETQERRVVSTRARELSERYP